MSKAKPIIWGASTTRTLRAIWMAEEVGLDYELRKIGPRTGETQTPEYTALNPKQKIPLLVDGDFKLSESLAICRYLVENHGRQGDFFQPKNSKERARYDEWCAFILSELDATSLYIIRRHGDLSYIYGESLVVVESAKVYFSRQVEAASQMFNGEYVMGDRFGAADVMLTVCLDWARATELPIPEKLEAYRQRMTARPAFDRARQINKIDSSERAS